MQSDLFDPVGSSLRTSLASAIAEQIGCSASWKRSATPAGRSWLRLAMSERRTSASVCSSWPTATACGFPPVDLKALLDRRSRCKAKGANGNGFGLTLEQAAALEAAGMLGQAQGRQWPTPLASHDCGERMMGGNLTLLGAARANAWPTSTGQDAKHSTLPESQRDRDHLPGAVLRLSGPRGLEKSSEPGKHLASLNSRWVAQLMGFPADWCAAIAAPKDTPTGEH